MPSKKLDGLFRLSQFWLFIVILLLGIFFRFANLDGKVFWVDEVATAVRVSGYTVAEITQDLQAQDVVTPQDLWQYQIINQERNFIDSWRALTKSPEHAPLYFLLTRLWLDLWGNSITIIRALSACFSLLIFPSLYWLLQELFNQPLISLIGVMLMSVSPFYVAYAQEARPYSFWTVTILVVGASFLRAIKLNNWQVWTIYIVSLVLGFYTSLLSLFIAIFQGIYLLLCKFKNKVELIRKYCYCNAIALVFFSPWLYIILTGIQTLQDNTVWMRTSLDLTALIATWIGTILLIFGDLPLSPDADAVQTAIAVICLLAISISIFILISRWHQIYLRTKKVITYLSLVLISLILISLVYFKDYFTLDIVTLMAVIVAVCILSLAFYSLYFVIKNTLQKQWLFIICLLLSLPVPLLVSDLISQGQSSGAPRYLIPTQLAIQIAAAYTFGTKLGRNNVKSLEAKTWKIILILFLTLGVFSCGRNLDLSPIYLKSRSIHNQAIAEVINRQPNSLVIVEPIMVNDVLSLSHQLSEKVRIKAIFDNDDTFLSYQDRFSYLYLLKPSETLKNKLAKNQNITLKKVYQPKLLTPGQFTLDLWLINRNK